MFINSTKNMDVIICTLLKLDKNIKGEKIILTLNAKCSILLSSLTINVVKNTFD